MYDETHRLVRNDTGEEVPVNGMIVSFRDEAHTFLGITRHPGDGTGTSGKIVARDDSTGWRGEYYPSVFGCRVEPRPAVVEQG